MAETKFNIPMAAWELAIDQLYGMLEEVARRGPRATITYGEAVDRLTAVRLEPDSHAFHNMLGEVSTRSFDGGGPVMSALIVHKDDGRPGRGCCKCARGLGFEVARDRLAEDSFWGQQVEAVYAWWRAR